MEEETKVQPPQATEAQNQEEKLPENLSLALENAELILSHATENGLEIKQETIKILVDSKQHEKQNSWTPESEMQFWMAYRNLSKLIKPVSVGSLRAAQEKPPHPKKADGWFSRVLRLKNKPSRAKRAVRRYTIFGLISMIAMLIIQIYSLKATTLLNSIQTGTARMTELESRVAELNLIPSENNKSTLSEKQQILSKIGKITKEVNTSVELLKAWLNFSSSLGLTAKPKEDPKPKQETQQAPIDFLEDATVMSDESQMEKNVQIIQEAKNLTLILGLYILPLLYGLLGGFAFVLRNLAGEIKSLTYSKESDIKFALRIHLGALAGLAVGLFWGDLEKQQLGFIESLSPLAVAFIAGYSVEFVFKLIDRLIFSIEKREDDNNQDNQNKGEKTPKPQTIT